MLRSLLTLFFIAELICCISAIFFFIKKRNKFILIFIPFLITTVIVEFLGTWWNYYGNVWGISSFRGKNAMYNVFTCLEFIFYALLFYMHFKKIVFQKMIIFFIPLFIIASCINILFIQGFNKTLNTNTLLLGSFFIVLFCCCFFYESLLPDQIEQQLTKNYFFWVCSGLLMFYLGSVIIHALFEYLTSKDLQAQGLKIISIINSSLNVILYSSFCIAFYLCPTNKKTSSSQL